MTSKTHLSPEQLAVLLEQLRSRFAEMERRRVAPLQGMSQADSARETLLQDADDTTQRAGAHEVEASVSNLERVESDAVRSALQRIQGAAYGFCVDCRAAIPFERLRVEPQALRCIACEALHERSGLR